MEIIWMDQASGARVARDATFARLVHPSPDGAGYWLTPRTLSEVRRRRSRAPQTGSLVVSPAEWASATARLTSRWSETVGAKLPDDVREEAVLRLLARPGEHLEYMGRGRFTGRVPEGSVQYLDVAGGRRAYAFRSVDGFAGQGDARSRRVERDFGLAGSWLRDPDARVVLSMGGGGYRLFSALAAVRVIERLLEGDRRRVHEVWGCSGGALLGYAFSRGHDLAAVERLGYELYRGKDRDLPGIHLRSLANYLPRVAYDWAAGRAGSPELAAWVDAVDRLSAPSTGEPLPFFAMVSNARWRYPVAFTDPRHIAPHCADLLVACSPRDATAASMAVPFVFRPLRGVAGYEDDDWFDGSVAEENPLLLPFMKWLRDRRAAPSTTPKKLKLLLVNLNTRLSESKLLGGLSKLALVRKLSGVTDLMLDSKTHATIRALSEVGDVEVMTATLSLGRLSFITRSDIPEMIRSGQIIEGWDLDLRSATPLGLTTGSGGA